jgi:tetratricopeptide (TPR) repeat protein
MRIAAVILVLIALGRPASAQDPDERARALFLTQKYPEALSIYQRLYSESHHPTYLRNMGRCHQMMRHPDQAIADFRAYLGAARDLTAGERAEIAGYIEDMERLKATPPPVLSLAETTAEPEAEPVPITHRVWFWAGLGALALGAVAVGVALGSHPSRLPCPADTVCP